MTKNTFLELVQDAGCVVEENERPIVFTCEPALFRRELSLKIRSDPQYPSSLDEFFGSMNTYLQEVDVLRRFLLPATLSDHLVDTRQTSTLDSMIKTLLSIDVIQPTLITYLLERLPEFYDELENDNSSSCTARLILHQLRWSEYIVEPQSLTGKLIEVIQITPTVIQHEIITSLPDIINDSEHKPIVVYLKELMDENTELTAPILDALSNLTLHSESLEGVRETVLNRLESAELDDLAVIIKFLLQTVNPYSVDEVIYGIREKLDFRSLGKSTMLSFARKSKQSPEALILDSIKLGFESHKYVCDAWLKSIAALETKPGHKIIDVLVLIILHSMTSMKKKAETLLRKKVISGLITSPLIQETILQHAGGLAGYWDTILSLSESLLRSSDQHSVAIPCSSTLYICAFKSSDAYYRQEIIGSLVTHIGSGSATEMDVSLDTLHHLAKTDIENIVVYDIFIKGILDYLDSLTLLQIRVLFNIFSLLSLTAKDRKSGTSSFWSEIQIIIRKHLSIPRDKYKRIGIIGCLAAVKVLASADMCDNNEAAGSSTQRELTADEVYRHPLLRQATNLVEMALHNCQEYPVCLALVYDELAYMLEHANLDKRMELYIKEQLTSDFIEQYVADIEEVDSRVEKDGRRQEVTMKPQVLMNLDGEESSIAINFYSLLIDNEGKKKKRLVVPLCALFNLLQSSEKVTNSGSLEDIDALVGCGLVLFDDADIEDLVHSLDSYELQDACDLLYYAINWCRELLNAFASVSEKAIHLKIVQRLKDILKLEANLGKFIKKVSSYIPLDASLPIADIKETGIRSSLAINSAMIATGSGGTGETSDSEAKTTKRDHKPNLGGTSYSSVEALRSHMRALNVDVLSILSLGDAILKGENKLSYPELNYILKDLNEKLKTKIMAPSVNYFGKKKTADDKQINLHSTTMLSRLSASDLMKQVLKHLPSILQRLESIYEDGLLQDTQSGRIGSGSEAIVECTAQITDIIFKLVSWREIENPEHRDILESIIRILASRSSETPSDAFDISLREAFKYLAQFTDNMPNATTVIVLYKSLMRIMALSEGDEEIKHDAYKVVVRISSTDWLDWRDIKKDITELVEQTIKLNEDPLEALHTYVDDVLPRYNEDGRQEEYPLLRSDTVLFYYQAMINQTVEALHFLEQESSGDCDDEDAALEKIGKVVKIFRRITSYIKDKNQKLMYSILLRTGRTFIEQFTKHTLPYFSEVAKRHKDEILSIIKDFQSCTRMLQITCSHVKLLKDTVLAGYVPALKKAMEIFLFQLKIFLTANLPAESFTMAALKHKDIRGAEVSSQIPPDMSSGSEVEENEEESSSPKRKRPKAVPRKRPKDTEENEIRTTSQVPTTDDDEDDEEQGLAVKPEEESEMMEIDLSSSEDEQQPVLSHRKSVEPVIPIYDDDDEEEEIVHMSPPPPPLVRTTSSDTPSEPLPPKRRLGLGRPNIPKRMQNSIASIEQIERTPSRKDGISEELEETLRNFGCEFIQSAGILLKLPQVAMATAQVLFHRFFYMASLKEFGIIEIGMGALFLGSKVEESFTRLTYMVAVYDYLVKKARNQPTYPPLDTFSQRSYDLKNMIITGEMQILKRLGFNVHVQLPYGLMINYLRILGLEEDEKVAGRAWNYLNDGLRSTVYATYEPATIACAAIWLACRDQAIKLPPDWYLLFDTDLENVVNAAGQVRRVYYTKLDRERLPLYPNEMNKWLANNRS